jgi:hypothetical protein
MRFAPASLLTAAALAAGLSCGRREPARLPALEANLQRRVEGLTAMIADAQANGGRIVRFDHILVVVRQRLIQGVLDAGLPVERTLGGRYRVVADRAEVLLEDGFATVRLDGRAHLTDRQDVRADISIHGAIDIVDLDPESGVLRGRVKVYAMEARKVEVAGFEAPIAQLVEDLGRERLETFEALLTSLEIPVRVGGEIVLPRMGPEGGITIQETSVPVHAVVENVKSFRHRLWVTIRTGVGQPTPSASAP